MVFAHPKSLADLNDRHRADCVSFVPVRLDGSASGTASRLAVRRGPPDANRCRTRSSCIGLRRAPLGAVCQPPPYGLGAALRGAALARAWHPSERPWTSPPRPPPPGCWPRRGRSSPAPWSPASVAWPSGGGLAAFHAFFVRDRPRAADTVRARRPRAERGLCQLVVLQQGRHRRAGRTGRRRPRHRGHGGGDRTSTCRYRRPAPHVATHGGISSRRQPGVQRAGAGQPGAS